MSKKQKKIKRPKPPKATPKVTVNYDPVLIGFLFVKGTQVVHQSFGKGMIYELAKDKIIIKFVREKENHLMSHEIALRSLSILKLPITSFSQRLVKNLLSKDEAFFRILKLHLSKKLSFDDIKTILVPTLMTMEKWNEVNCIKPLFKKDEDIELNDLLPNEIINTSIVLIVKGKNTLCMQKHQLEYVEANIPYIKQNPLTKCYLKVIVGYCKDCKQYYILENDYNLQIKKFEKSLICKIITTEKYLNSKFNDFSNLESQSLLNKCGYSVGKEKNLSFKMRQNILLFIIKNHIMNIEQIKSHLSFLITMRKSDQTMEDAIQKWEQDINYIDSLKIAKKKVIVKVIKK